MYNIPLSKNQCLKNTLIFRRKYKKKEGCKMKKLAKALWIEKSEGVYIIGPTAELQDDVGTVGFVEFSRKDKLEKLQINVPLVAGIMPVTNAKQIKKITSLCSCTIPKKFLKILEKYEDNPSALKEAGLAYAIEQVVDLVASDINGIHLYTMNRPETAKKIIDATGIIRK